MLAGTILRVKKKRNKSNNSPVLNEIRQGITAYVLNCTRAVFNTSVSRQTILNLACSVIHPNPNGKKQIIILLTAIIILLTFGPCQYSYNVQIKGKEAT